MFIHGNARSRIPSFLNGSADKEYARNIGDTEDVGLIPGSGGSHGGGYGNPLQCSFLKNLMDIGVWWATVTRTQRDRHYRVTEHTDTYIHTHTHTHTYK